MKGFPAKAKRKETPTARQGCCCPRLSGFSFLILCLAASLPWGASARQASFVEGGAPAAAAPAFSGLAVAPEQTPSVSPAAPGASSPLLSAAPVVQAADPITKIEAAALPQVSPETVGVRQARDFGIDMWKGTPRALADKWLDMAPLTASAVLNDLLRRLYLTQATPPEGPSTRSPVAVRARKLLALGDAPAAWALASAAEPTLIDDETMVTVVEHVLIGGSEDVCNRLLALAQARAAADFQKSFLLCQLRARDVRTAQVTIDTLRASPTRDDMFLLVAEKNVLGDQRILPTQLTPLTAPLLGVLRLTGLPLPGQLYGRPNPALVPALLRAPTKQDVAQLTLAERAATRGLIDVARLAEIYKGASFKPDALAAPLATAEAGSRLRALLFQSASSGIDARLRIALATRFVREAPPELLGGAGGIVAAMVGDINPDALYAPDALVLTQAYMLADKNALALEWYKLARQDASFSFATNETLLAVWPQIVLSGLENAADYATDLDKWTDAALRRADGGDTKAGRETIAAALLLLDANGFAVGDTQWEKVIAAPTRNEKRMAVPTILIDRLRAAAAAGRRAEAVLAAAAIAGDGDIPLPLAVELSRSLRQAGFKAEAALFARAALYGFGGRFAP